MKKKSSKKKENAVEEPEAIIVESIMDQFLDKNKKHFFSKVQVTDTMMANKNDVDKAIASLKMRFSKGSNIKKKIHDEVEIKKTE